MKPFSPDFTLAGPAGSLEDIELSLLLEGLYRRHGFDFRDYAPATIRRRVLHALQVEGLPTISALQERVLRDTHVAQRLVEHLAVSVTEMFRDPSVFRALREQVVPLLRTHPFVRIWHAGCATGEEVYSLAILLHEEGLLERSRLYATDLSANALRRARDGIYPADRLELYERNYTEAGGRAEFSGYLTQQYGHGIVRADLRRSIVWGQHNLATDGSFNEFHLVLCRNVLIYFNSALQTRVFSLLHDSLATFGMLALGRHESLDFASVADRFSVMNAAEKLYKKVA